MAKSRLWSASLSDIRNRKLGRIITLSSDEEMDEPLQSKQPNGAFNRHPPSALEEAKPVPFFSKPVPLFAMPKVVVPSLQNEGFNRFTMQSADINHQGDQKQQNKKPENTLYNQYEEKIRPCIELIDSLRALRVENDLALPVIVVIGDQSSGKSSVLEALSEVPLPRGSGIVTRCPLVLDLKKLPSGHRWKGQISYLDKHMELSDPSEVEKEIRRAQNLMAGEGVGISHELIFLEISSPEVPDLTLIDLPGIPRVAENNQTQNIGDQIQKLVKKIIDKQDAIILMVVPATVDISKTEALKIAQEVDPDGDKTLGILTMPDLIDEGAEKSVLNIVRNLVIPLKKGYMTVKCRGQEDIQSNMTLASAIQKEQEFFENHKNFSILLQEKKATIPLLAEKLTTELVRPICKSVPSLEEQINFQLQKANDAMHRIGKGMPKTDSEQWYFLTDKIKLFNDDITGVVQGEEKLSEDYMKLCSRIRTEFNKWGLIIAEHGNKIQMSLRPEWWNIKHQNRGRELPGFMSYKTFESMMRKHIMELEMPATEMLNKITEIVHQAFMEVAKDHFEGFPQLYVQAKNRIESIKEKQVEEAEANIRIQFAMEQILFCQDRDYMTRLRALKEKNCEEATPLLVFIEQTPPQALDTGFGLGTPAEEDTSGTDIVYHLKTYFKSAGRRLSCQIPLIIQFYVLKKFGDILQNEMLQLLRNKENLKILLQERRQTAEWRQVLSDRIHRLTEARNHLAKFAD